MLVAVTIKVVYRFTTIRGDADARQYPWCPSAKWAMMHDGDWFRNDPQVRLIALTKVKRYGDDNVMADGMEMLSWGLGDSQPAAREVARNRTRGRCW